MKLKLIIENLRTENYLLKYQLLNINDNKNKNNPNEKMKIEKEKTEESYKTCSNQEIFEGKCSDGIMKKEQIGKKRKIL